jgi:negative regulator of flagellin synthesis FlgM
MKVNEYISGTKANPYVGEAKNGQKEGQPKTPVEQAREGTTGDKVQLSGRSREIARAQELVTSTPEVRADKVADIKAKIEAGTYNVNAVKVADAILRSTIDEKV